MKKVVKYYSYNKEYTDVVDGYVHELFEFTDKKIYKVYDNTNDRNDLDFYLLEDDGKIYTFGSGCEFETMFDDVTRELKLERLNNANLN